MRKSLLLTTAPLYIAVCYVASIENTVLANNTETKFSTELLHKYKLHHFDTTVQLHSPSPPPPPVLPPNQLTWKEREDVSIRKCCAPNQIINVTSKTYECVSNNRSSIWNPILYSNLNPEEMVLNQTNISFETVGLPRCKWTFLHNVKDTWFNILEDGTPTVGLNFWTIPLWLKVSNYQDYCVDRAGEVNETGTEYANNEVLFFCELDGFQSYLDARTIYGVMFMTSSLAMVVTLAIYLLIWNHHNIHGWTQFWFFVSFLLYMFFEGSRILVKRNGLLIRPSKACFVHAIVSHYFTIVISGTSCVMSLDCFMTFWYLDFKMALHTVQWKLRQVQAGMSKKVLLIYQLLAWGIPLVAFIVGLILHFKYNTDNADREINGYFQYGHYRCSSPIWELAFRVQLFMLITNFLAFVGTSILIVKHLKSTGIARNNSSKRRRHFRRSLKLFIKLFLVTGTTWTLTSIDLFFGYKNPMGWIFHLVRAYLTLQGIVYLGVFGVTKRNFVKLAKKFPSIAKSSVLSRVFGTTTTSTRSNTDDPSRTAD